MKVQSEEGDPYPIREGSEGSRILATVHEAADIMYPRAPLCGTSLFTFRINAEDTWHMPYSIGVHTPEQTSPEAFVY